MRKSLTDHDRTEWANYAHTVHPFPNRPRPEPPAAPHPAPPRATKPVTTPRTLRTTPLAVGNNPGGIDKSNWNRLRTGKTHPERTLDLHGRTADRAFHALQSFLHTAHAEGIRCVEIITGRGTGETGGVLRREFPNWLNRPDLRPLILAATHPHPNNPGAVRLLLRRTR